MIRRATLLLLATNTLVCGLSVRADAPPSLAPSSLIPPDIASPGIAVASQPWWHQAVAQPLGIHATTWAVTADDAALRALAASPHVEGIRLQPLIRQTELTRQQAAFDWTSFLESSWADRSDPIGSILTTGAASGRFEDRLLSGSAGIRKFSTSGAQWQLGQRALWQQNNSTFLIPNPQSTSRLEVTLTQPLLAGRGQAYTLRRVLEARLIIGKSKEEAIAALQDHLLQVNRAYWELYRTRAAFLQRQRAAEQAQQLADSLAQRTGLDATGRQILRARTATAQRQAELMAAAGKADIAANEFRHLIGDGQWDVEVVPVQRPPQQALAIDPPMLIQTALTGRAEIAQAVYDIRAASVRLGASRQELLPQLDLIAGAYVAGLAPQRTLVDAYGNQFVDGRPSLNLGLSWQRPMGNRAAQANLRRHQLEMQDAVARYEAAVQSARADAQLAIDAVQLASKALRQQQEAYAASLAEANFLSDRWRTAPTADGPAVLLLQDLIDAQTRVADEETALASAEADLAVAIVRLHWATGTLLRRYDATAHENRLPPEALATEPLISEQHP